MIPSNSEGQTDEDCPDFINSYSVYCVERVDDYLSDSVTHLEYIQMVY